MKRIIARRLTHQNKGFATRQRTADINFYAIVKTETGEYRTAHKNPARAALTCKRAAAKENTMSAVVVDMQGRAHMYFSKIHPASQILVWED